MSTRESSQIEMTEVLDSIEEMLECPVCLLVPRQGPIPSCPAGCIINKFWHFTQSYFKDTSSVKLAEKTWQHPQHAEGRWTQGRWTPWPRVLLTESGTVASSKSLAAPSRSVWRLWRNTKAIVTTELSPVQHAKKKSNWRNSTIMPKAQHLHALHSRVERFQFRFQFRVVTRTLNGICLVSRMREKGFTWPKDTLQIRSGRHTCRQSVSC